MPFRSTAQQRYMFARHPGIAHRWADEMKGAHRKGARQHPIKSAGLPNRVGKGLGSLLRKPKAANPILRTGVQRAGRVGVEFEHQGVKGWGVNETAARMAWQQNHAMAKRHDVGKSDSWEVPMDHFEPALPRRRPNYGAGNTVGKRMTGAGASTGVVSPKKVQATRIAPRTAAAAVKIPQIPKGNQPPIPPHMVGKRDRRFDPEARRQRRLGLITAGAGIGGAASVGSAARDVRRDSRALRGIDPSVVHVPGKPSQPRKQTRGDGGKMRSLTPEENEAEQRNYNERIGNRTRRLETRSALERARAAGEHGAVVSRRSGGKIALGGGLLAASAGLAHHGRSRANRQYR